MADKTRMSNKAVIEALFSRDPSMQKEAQDIANEVLQTKAREDGIMRGPVLGANTLGMDELDPQVDVEAPTKIFEKEPDIPAAITVPFGHEANAMEITGNRGLVVFHKITTKRHRKDKHLLATFQNDVRQLITDNDLKEILEEEDVTTFALIDDILGGAPGTSVPMAGDKVLWKSIPGTLTPQTWVDAMQIMMKTSARFRPATVVMNQVLAENLVAWDGDELSQSILEEVNQRGWVQTEFKGRNLVITIKRNVVADNEMYMFAEPSKLGRFWILEDVTMFPKAEGTILEWWSEEVIGITLQPIGCAKVTLEGV